MAELTQRFKAEALDRTGQIELLLSSLRAATDPALICDEIREHAHKLKGASGIFGFDEFKDRAAEVEEESAAQSGAADGETAYGALAPVVGGLMAAIPAQ
ncbi:MAG: Hpt domain-containing protein [Thermoleophilaceae bacterium]|nr:Hpt domain-containing protein [Thermoleophilaceae bacterium]